MATLLYKRLFEIHILNDFYLTSENTSFFSNSHTNADRLEIMTAKLAQGNLNLTRDIEITTDSTNSQKLRNQRIKFTQTALGLNAVIEVNQSTLEDGTIVYIPVIPLSPEFKVSFIVRVKNSIFKNFTIGRLKPRFPSIFYFNNLNQNGDKQYPSLSHPVPPFDSNITYETGELADFGGTIREALVQNSSNIATNWRDVDGSGFVSERDRQLLPRKFTYQFSHIPGLTAADIVLTDEDSNEIKAINISNPKAFRNAIIDFEEDDAGNDISSGHYNITITDGASYTDHKNVYLEDNFFDEQTYAVIEVMPTTTDSNFRTIAPDGFLVHRRPLLGNAIAHPVFEIRLRNRITYWRYTSTEPFAGPSPDHLEPGPSNNILQSKQPNGLSLAPSVLAFAPDPPVLYPNPKPSPLKYEPDGKIYSDISINKLNRLTKN